jgi:hypothetical protein
VVEDECVCVWEDEPKIRFRRGWWGLGVGVTGKDVFES